MSPQKGLYNTSHVDKERIGIAELYKFYKETLGFKGKSYRSKEMMLKDKYRYIIDLKLFSGILADFNKEVARLIIDRNVEFMMPHRMGTVRIRKFKKKFRLDENGEIIKKYIPINWAASKKLWKEMYKDKTPEEIKEIKGKPRIRFFNEHTDGYVFKLYWNKHRCVAKNKSYYKVLLTRANKRHLADLLINDPNINYYE